MSYLYPLNMDHKLFFLFALCAIATAVPHETGSSVEVTSAAPSGSSKTVVVKQPEDLDNTIAQAGDKVVLVFFYSSTCPFCKKVIPTVEDVAATTNNLLVLAVDYDVLADPHAEAFLNSWSYGLNKLPSVPRFIFVKNGKKVEELRGSDTDIRGAVAKVLSPSFVAKESTDN